MRLPLHLFELKPTTNPWRKAWCSALAVGLPALLAIWLQQPAGILFGALGGLYATLIDFGATFRHRVTSQLTGALLILACGAFGVYMGRHEAWILPLLAALTFGIGWLDGNDLALETILRLAALVLLIYAYTPGFPLSAVPYVLLGFAIGLAVTGLDSLLWQRADSSHRGLKLGLVRILAGRNAGLPHALCFAFTCTTALGLALALEFQRPAWIAAVTLFVLKPDGPDSLRRLLQNAVGTLAGVPLAWAVVRFSHDPRHLLLAVVLLAFLRPLGMARNYWVHTAAMTALVLILLDIVWLPNGGDISLLRVRVIDVLVGSAVALVGLMIFNAAARRHVLKRIAADDQAGLG
ncbi:Fusaric acid resistance protein-like [Andreprevotia lacus DSM 23236]|uniref:Fusaric acid resistance protein-like n=1 Tax=Andreprevotia lacus DSM 23236 TaxID=1121001 RepID=A0A1W1XRR3_9NEIS|nr:FUSC family protein [Andreprevotia lacus]SMC26659.1 Fusaric acid resistance protein-like [Andreprevotia lacus DSM 23236]